jgi:hypothetical protein
MPRHAGERLRAHRPGAALLVALALLPVAACAASVETPTLPDGVTVALVQLRGDVAARQAQVQLTNGSGDAVVVGDVRVEDPRFDGPATRVVDRVSTVPDGGRVDIKIQLPPVACPAPEDSVPEIVLEIGDATMPVRTVADDPLGFIAPLHERECLGQALSRAATVDFTAFEPSPPGAAAGLELTVTPSGEGAATIVAVQATNLLDFGPDSVEGTYPLDLEIEADGRTQPIVVKVPIVPFRCDPHAVQEDKRGTIFDIRLALDGEPGEIELFVGDELRGRILTWVADWCGFGAG